MHQVRENVFPRHDPDEYVPVIHHGHKVLFQACGQKIRHADIEWNCLDEIRTEYLADEYIVQVCVRVIGQIVEKVAFRDGAFVFTVRGHHRHTGVAVFPHEPHPIPETQVVVEKAGLFLVREEKEQILSQKRHPLKTLSLYGRVVCVLYPVCVKLSQR